MKEAVIVAAVRTAVGKAPRGTLRTTRPDDMAAAVIEDLLRRVPELPPETIDDVIMGCATPEGESGANVARIAALRAGLPHSVPAVTVNRFCSSGSQTIAMAAERIMAGMAQCIIAGGTESMSMLRGNTRFRPNPYLVEHQPDVYLSMGLTAENVSRKYNVSREEADAFSYRSHQRALAAQAAGRFKDDGIVPLEVEINEVGDNGNGTSRGGAESAKACRPHAGPDRSDRTQRGVCLSGYSGDARTRNRRRAHEHERRGRRARTPAGGFGSKANRAVAGRDAPAQVALRHGDDVRRRRPGRGDDLRESSELEDEMPVTQIESIAALRDHVGQEVAV